MIKEVTPIDKKVINVNINHLFTKEVYHKLTKIGRNYINEYIGRGIIDIIEYHGGSVIHDDKALLHIIIKDSSYEEFEKMDEETLKQHIFSIEKRFGKFYTSHERLIYFCKIMQSKLTKHFYLQNKKVESKLHTRKYEPSNLLYYNQ